MLSLLLGCRENGRTANFPMRFPYPFKFRIVVKEVHATSLRVVGVRYAVYQTSSIGHNGALIPRIRQPWQNYVRHLKWLNTDFYELCIQ